VYLSDVLIANGSLQATRVFSLFVCYNIPMMNYYVYVLQSHKDDKFYIGFTNNIERRMIEHNSGQGTSTAPRRPFKLIYYEAHLSKEDAMRRERYFKTTKGKVTLRQVLKDSLDKQ
jgi:putative endonuclease